MKKAFNPFLNALIAFALLVAGCEKEVPYHEPEKQDATPINVLKSGSGFMESTAIINNVFPNARIFVHDFAALPTENKLSVLYYTKHLDLYGNDISIQGLGIYDLATKKVIRNSGYKGGPFITDLDIKLGYFPYTTKMVGYIATPYYQGTYQRFQIGGYAQLTDLPWELTDGQVYKGGWGYQNGYADFDVLTHYMVTDPRPDDLLGPVWTIRKYESPSHKATNLVYFPEPRSGGATPPVVVIVSPDSVVSYTFEYNPDSTKISTNFTQTGFLIPSGYSQGSKYNTQRHYNADGSKMVMLVSDQGWKNCWTYFYDFNSNTLSAGMSAVPLQYAGDSALVDMDDEGNIYYTGISGQGSGKGISVYKRTTGGTSLIGTDDFLAFGTISALHWVNNKVYMIVTGTLVGSSANSSIGSKVFNQITYVVEN